MHLAAAVPIATCCCVVAAVACSCLTRRPGGHRRARNLPCAQRGWRPQPVYHCHVHARQRMWWQQRHGNCAGQRGGAACSRRHRGASGGICTGLLRQQPCDRRVHLYHRSTWRAEPAAAAAAARVSISRLHSLHRRPARWAECVRDAVVTRLLLIRLQNSSPTRLLACSTSQARSWPAS